MAVACVAALLTACTACTAQEQPPPHAAGTRTSSSSPSPSHTAPRCDGDSYVWRPVVQRRLLVAISDAKEIRIPAHGSASPPEPRLIRPLTAEISPTAVEAGVDPADALAALEDQSQESLEPIGTRFVLDDDAGTGKMINESDTTERGRFVEAEGVRLVTARFSVTCAGGTVRGTITTWGKGPIGVSVRCGIKEHLPELSREAERRACAAQLAVPSAE
ncbi:hypothetical protein ACFWVC_07535 [Streptomyces sp. NPDC058691]|uniref:hypothetical protein n=1 Tax=Streptomyces sp. NPDC058691 TaxID=3346601 RepID=UPI003665D090